MTHIVILTGAGISAESGLRTFRAADGLWEDHRIEDVATPAGYARDPALVLRFYNERRAAARMAQPNAAHRALGRLMQDERHRVTLITQNVDDLHEREGAAPGVIHMHGSLFGALCARCDHRWPAPMVMQVTDACPACGKTACRPDIVWFGEMPHAMDRIDAALARADLFVSIGTSGNVYPAAGFVADARRAGIETLELNLDPSAGSRYFDRAVHGPATQIVPDWVAAICPAPYA